MYKIQVVAQLQCMPLIIIYIQFITTHFKVNECSNNKL